jgi:hypothetical protein
MAKYYVNFEPSQERVIRYEDLSVCTYHGIAPQVKHELYVAFRLTKSVEIREASSGRVLAKSQQLALLNAVCELTFEADGEQKRIEMRPTNDSRLYVGGNSLFSCPIDAKDGEFLNSWRKGRTVLIKWKIRGHAAVIDSADFPTVVWVDYGNWIDSRNALPSLDSDAFAAKIMKKLNLSNTLIEQFPLEIPAKISNASGLPVGISSLMIDVRLLAEHLNNAVQILRNAKSSLDYRHVMDEVKSALEPISKYKNRQDLGKELLVETSIIGNLDANAGDTAAKEVICNFMRIMENAYWIASKPAHAKLQKSGDRFSMHPDRSEALLVLVVGLAAFRFLLERIGCYVETVL